ncbi:MAG: NADPH:quinone reductase [Dehalococcoidia bacterium]
MRAAWYERYGPAREVFQIGELPQPRPGTGEVLVRVHCSGVNPSDWRTRTGSRGEFPFERIVPHSDGAGVIEALGGGVDGRAVGQRVWMFNAQWQRPMGTAAEYVALPAPLTVPLDGSLSFAEGACLGVPAMTAHRCLFADGTVEGKTVLVTGGAGAVGNYAVQLAKWGGAAVIATVSSEQKAEFARKAGADEVINYKESDVVSEVMRLTGGAGVDRIVEVDFGGNIEVSGQVLKMHGGIAIYSSLREREPKVRYIDFMRKNANLRFVHMYTVPEEAKQQAIADITQAIAEGALWHPIGARFPLEEIAAAHEAQESGKVTGNIVIDVA